MDHYEKAYVNGLLGTGGDIFSHFSEINLIVHPSQPGVLLYNYPLTAGLTKVKI